MFVWKPTVAVGAMFAFAAARAGADSGPPSEVRSVRVAERAYWNAHPPLPGFPYSRPRIGDVTVAGRFALVPWLAGDGGGEGLYRRDPARGWVRVAHGGGVMNFAVLRDYGVPAATARALLR